MSNFISSLTTIGLRRAADLKEKIEALTEELSAIFGFPASAFSERPKRREMNAAARPKIGAAQKARRGKANKTNPMSKVSLKKRGMSPAGRARVAAAQKARWAKFRAAANGSK